MLIISISRDITELLQAERAFQNQSLFLESLINAIGFPVFYKKVSEEYLGANEEFCKFIGRNLDEIVGKTVFDLFEQDLAERCHLDDLAIYSDPRTSQYETDMPSAEGIWHHLLFIKSPFFTLEGKVGGLIGAFLDLSERNRTEKALKKSEYKFRQIFESFIDLYYETDMNGIITVLSPSCYRLTGYKPDELIGTSVLDLYYYPEDREILHKEFLKNKGLLENYEVTLKYKDQRPAYVLLSARSMHDEEGNNIGISGSLRDISDRRRVEDALVLTNKKLNLLSDITRHDILNLLQGIDLLNDLITQQISDDSQVQRYLIVQKEGIEQAQRQIEFTRYYQGIGVNRPLWHNLNHVLEDIRSQIPDGVQYSFQVPPVSVYADALFPKVIENLVDNSLRHGEHVSKITILGEKEGDILYIIYSDDGVGILDEEKNQIFERGYGKNTGQGLSLSREILAITGIDIVETGKYTKGARFDLMIPQGAVKPEKRSIR